MSITEQDLEQKFAHLPAWKRDHEIRKAKAKQAKDEENKEKQDEVSSISRRAPSCPGCSVAASFGLHAWTCRTLLPQPGKDRP